ncbi:MAG: MFS transporter [Nitrosomonadales bacterium]|nr:MFS transporter [Nitrosomonadales bacterium]MBT6355834.1 MFS transporter [Nitrosomonadales bacterium]MCH9771461.1 MFS transporter [Betaproteobacteria bacterium]
MTSFFYSRLSSFYFSYYFFVGLFVPYWGIYLTSLSFSALQIGALLSLFQISRIFAPNFLGWIADRSGEYIKWIKISSFFGFILFIGIFWANSFLSIFLIMMAMSIFTSSTLPLAESLTLAHLKANKADSKYSHIRLWGSIGFIVAAILLGIMIDSIGEKSLIYALLLTQLVIFLLAFILPTKKVIFLPKKKRSIWPILKKREVVVLLLSCALMVSSHGLLYNFYSIFLEQQGYSGTTIGLLWAVGVIFEIIIFLLMPRILNKFTLKAVLLISLGFAVIRFFLIGAYVDSMILLFIAQVMHAATFGSFHVASIQLIAHFFYNEHQARGQSLYNSITYGVGGAIGGLGGGYMIEYSGMANTFMLSAILPFLGFMVLILGLKTKFKADLK